MKHILELKLPKKLIRGYPRCVRIRIKPWVSIPVVKGANRDHGWLPKSITDDYAR